MARSRNPNPSPDHRLKLYQPAELCPLQALPPGDRRGRDRYRFGRSPAVDFLVKPSFRCHRAAVRDLSSHGVGLVLGNLFEPSSVLAVQLRSLTANQSCIGLACVRHVTRLESGLWLLGCDFRQALSNEEVAGMIDDEIFEGAADEAMDPSSDDFFALLVDSLKPRANGGT